MGRSGFFVVLGLFFAVAVQGADPDLLRKHFENRFQHLYRPNRCGLNSLDFIRDIDRESHDPASLYLVQVENKGFSVFGMVNAEMTRSTLFDKPASVEANWYHHYFVVDDRGMVYDFDFTTEPLIVPLAQYFEMMYLDESRPGARFHVGRKDKLDDYQLTVINGRDVLNEDTSSQRTFRMRELLADWRLLLREPRPSDDCAASVAALPSRQPKPR